MVVQPRRKPAHELFDIDVDPMTLDEAITHCQSAIATRRPMQIGVVNAAKVVNMRRDEALRSAVNSCELILADGQSLVWASRLFGRPLPERVAGIDLFESLLAAGAERGHSVYLFGATQEVIEKVVAVVGERHPGLRIAGFRNGYYGPAEEAAIAADIAAAAPDMLFVAMGSPTKEKFVATYGPQMGVPVVHGVGGSFDVVAGLTKRAPLAWQRAGFEWLYRVLQEPGRLWQRYLTTNTAFLALVLREVLTGKARRATAASRSKAATALSQIHIDGAPHQAGTAGAALSPARTTTVFANRVAS